MMLKGTRDLSFSAGDPRPSAVARSSGCGPVCGPTAPGHPSSPFPEASEDACPRQAVCARARRAVLPAPSLPVRGRW